MRNCAIVIVIALLFTVGTICPKMTPSASAQTPVVPAAAKPAVAPSVVLPPGIHLVAEFDDTLNAKKLKPGSKVKGTLTQDLILKGKIVAPSESRLIGHVTEAKGATDADPSSRLGIVFDKILLKHHQELDFVGVVQALAPPGQRKSKVDMPSQMLPPSLMGGGGNAQANSTITPPGGSRGSNNNNNRTTSSGNTGASSMASMPVSAPVRIKSNPGSSPGDAVATVEVGDGAKPISAGLPQGVVGLPGLALSAGPSALTPGPVILSKSGSVKLEFGTQVLLKVSGPPPQQAQVH
ncbi:MAG: hypothetical protein LAO20_07685 [Acidobacteriia bacterium]|nr:hypothetical protein [Terriglobia bacterium]